MELPLSLEDEMRSFPRHNFCHGVFGQVNSVVEIRVRESHSMKYSHRVHYEEARV